MTSALFSVCTSASSHCRHLEISPIKWSPLSPPLPHSPSSYSAANRFREWDHRSVGPAGQEGRLQNLLRWGELQFVLPDSASLASFCWSDDWEKSKKKSLSLGSAALGRVGHGGCRGTGLVKISTSSGWTRAVLKLRCCSPLHFNIVNIMNWASKLRLHFSQFSSYSELDQTNEKEFTLLILHHCCPEIYRKLAVRLTWITDTLPNQLFLSFASPL